MVTDEIFSVTIDREEYDFKRLCLVPSIINGYYYELCIPEFYRHTAFALRCLWEVEPNSGQFEFVEIQDEPLVEYVIDGASFEDGYYAIRKDLLREIYNLECILINSLAYEGCDITDIHLAKNTIMRTSPAFGISITDEFDDTQLTISYKALSQMCRYFLPVFRGFDFTRELSDLIDHNLTLGFGNEEDWPNGYPSDDLLRKNKP